MLTWVKSDSFIIILIMNDLQRLTEMGITVWDLRRPELFEQKTRKGISLPSACKLLFICDKIPNGPDLDLFNTILASVNLLPNHALHLPYACLPSLSEHTEKWCWFCACEPLVIEGVKCLSSPSLSTLSTDRNAKKALWQQIQAHDKK